MIEGLVLGLESSCDETAAAVVLQGRKVLANIISSQVEIHARFGGVVPEVASRKHVEMILPVLDEALQCAGVGLGDLWGVAATQGPGLVGGLLVGFTAAKALAFGLGVPFAAVNHVEGHIYANVLAHPDLAPPFVCLTVSGGHTDLLHVPEFGCYQVLGRTRDDAAGEAFDKVARFVGLGYPGGPAVDRLAQEGDREAIAFPRAMLGDGTFDFSFSGLKTSAVNHVHNLRQRGEEIPLPDFAASFQEAIVDVLVAKTLTAAEAVGVEKVVLSGGVAANSRLRERMMAEGQAKGFQVYYPPLVLCTDNGAMIASAGYFQLRAGRHSPLDANVIPGLRVG